MEGGLSNSQTGNEITPPRCDIYVTPRVPFVDWKLLPLTIYPGYVRVILQHGDHGMPRRPPIPPPLNMAPISLRLSAPQLRRLKKLSQTTGLGMSELVRRAVDDYLDHRLETP